MSEPFTHYCHCGRWGSFGFGVSFLRGREGRWYCREHREVPTLVSVKESRSMVDIKCEFCKLTVRPQEVGVYQWTAGWVKQRVGGGGHGISLPQRANRWAHAYCVERVAAGYDERQEAML
jgi:hypothetical protein